MQKAKRARRKYTPHFKGEIVRYRRLGWTHREICRKFNVSLSTIVPWTRHVVLSSKQKLQIQRRRDKKVWTLEKRAEQGQKTAAHLKLYPRLKHSRESLLRMIDDFYIKNGRIPLKREINKHREFKRRFGSWNGAIRAAGFNPNPKLFAYKFVAKDGHRCDSFTERIIDDWLFDHSIVHERNFRYGRTKMTGDFLLGTNRVLEFFGLAGEQKHYDVIITRKRKLAKKLGVKLIEVYPRDIYPVNNLGQMI